MKQVLNALLAISSFFSIFPFYLQIVMGFDRLLLVVFMHIGGGPHVGGSTFSRRRRREGGDPVEIPILQFPGGIVYVFFSISSFFFPLGGYLALVGFRYVCIEPAMGDPMWAVAHRPGDGEGRGGQYSRDSYFAVPRRQGD